MGEVPSRRIVTHYSSVWKLPVVVVDWGTRTLSESFCRSDTFQLIRLIPVENSVQLRSVSYGTLSVGLKCTSSVPEFLDPVSSLPISGPWSLPLPSVTALSSFVLLLHVLSSSTGTVREGLSPCLYTGVSLRRSCLKCCTQVGYGFISPLLGSGTSTLRSKV